MPHLDPELKAKIDTLRSMEFILSSVMHRLGELSEWMLPAPTDLQRVLQWQSNFVADMAELQKLIDQDFAKQDLAEAMSRMLNSITASQNTGKQS